MTLSVTLQVNDSLIKELEKIPLFLRHQAGDKCFAAMARPVVQRAKELAPSSRETGSRGTSGSKWGRKATKKFSGRASMLQHNSGEHIGGKVYKGPTVTLLYIGAKWRSGVKQQFNFSEKGRRVFYWGRDQGRRRMRTEPNFLQKAWSETQSAAMEAFRTELAKQMKELKLG